MKNKREARYEFSDMGFGNIKTESNELKGKYNDMKTKAILILILAIVILVGCDNKKNGQNSEAAEESDIVSDVVPATASADVSEEAIDTDKPVIKDKSKQKEFVIKIGKEFDFMKDIKGTDQTEGDITDKIVVDDGGFDCQKTGVYIVKYNLTDSSGNKADEITRKITVEESKVMKAPPVFAGVIDGEAKAPEPPAVFGGAWYYKVVSSKDKWCGMEATVTLPSFDINRYDGSYDDSYAADPNSKNLDNPSVYFGGNAISESDVGLSLSKVVLDGKSKISTGSMAFRPFWRYITSENKDLGGYDVHNNEYAVSANGNNCFANYHWRFTEYYYLPGDTLRIVIAVPEANKMQLQIEVISVSTLPESMAIRQKYGWKDPEDFIGPVFQSPGHGTNMNVEFKRVNAIDQSGNEGKTAINTETTITNAIWHSTYLYRVIDGTLYRVPMNDERSAVRAAPYESAFDISYEGVDKQLGGEIVSVIPKK